MKQKYWILALVLILLLSTSIHFVNEAREHEDARENARIANETKQQMEYISSLQIESEKIFSQDQDAQNLVNENTSFRAYEIIHNESFVEYIYIVGFHLQKVKYSTEPRITNGTVYRYYIDLSDKSVTAEDGEGNIIFNQSSNLLILRSNVHKEKNDMVFDSGIMAYVWPGVHLSNRVIYSYKIEGKQNISIISSSAKKPSIEYKLQIKKLDDTDSIYLPFDLNEENVRILSDNNSLPTKYWVDERKKDLNTLTMSLPGKVSYPINWYYIVNVGCGNNQTIVFDIDMTADGWGENIEPEELYGWRFIIETPPNTDGMSEEEMIELGIWPTNGFGGFYPLSTTIIKKGEWLDNV
ncbi:MAG: hypothetical protein PWQ44_1434 [Methanolobus sp.]|nr:hypothetical protein [Methanolobus sp.]